MKTIITTLNAKYIHTSLALRWLYVANKERCDISFREYTLKEDPEKILEELLGSGCHLLGLSVYIWNVEQAAKLVAALKQRNPQLLIVLGGPEVTYEPEYFLREWQVDYVISGEGEFVLGELIAALEQGGQEILIDGVSSQQHITSAVVKANLEELGKLPSPYMLEEDKENLSNRMVYFETSRGCPYQCQYCLSSREKGVRYFPQEYVLKNLAYLMGAGARQIKFLDRTFNLNRKHTLAVFDYLITHHRPGLSCQFEVYADLLDDALINYLNQHLPHGYFRFEVGIQSTYEPTNEEVKRKQDFPLLASNLRKLMEGGRVDLHVDLIAGLPFETYDRFVQSFNDVFVLRAKEVQLGFLKMLRGTNLRRNAALYGYSYHSHAPYEITANNDISSEELHRIHIAEHALERYWNSGRFRLTMHEVFDKYYSGRYFEFFEELGQYQVQTAFPARGYQLEDLFGSLHEFLLSKEINLFELLRTDYYNNFTLRPQGFWKKQLEKRERKQLLYAIGQDKEFLRRHGLTRKVIEKQTAIDPLGEGTYLLTLFQTESGQTERRTLSYTVC